MSVVIPVFNAEPYLEEAVTSALAQPETEKVVLVDDGSTDTSWSLCQSLARDAERVVALRHHDGANHGAGPTRNLGILSTTTEFVAFLDADDYYLPGRFEATFETFRRHPDADGVYECLGTHFETEDLRASYPLPEYKTLRRKVPPDRLFFAMSPVGRLGGFSFDAVVVRRSIFDVVGYFSDSRTTEDSELAMRMAIAGRLYPGNIASPVAMRRVHGGNWWHTTSKREIWNGRRKMWFDMARWMRRQRKGADYLGVAAAFWVASTAMGVVDAVRTQRAAGSRTLRVVQK